MVRSALITGITGQDGSYLAELLLEKGYLVHGLVRRSSSFSTGRIDHLYRDIHEKPQLLLHYGDLTDGQALTNLVQETEPDEIYNLGARWLAKRAGSRSVVEQAKTSSGVSGQQFRNVWHGA